VKKESTICFQTSSEIKSALEKIAEEKQQTVSYIVEAIVSQYLKSNRGFQEIIQNRRRCDRKKVSLKAFIGDPRWQRRNFVKGTILDISLGGIRFSVPKGTTVEILAGDKATEYSVIFTLPNNLWQTNVKCRSQRALESEEAVQVGAAFVSLDPSTCSTLQKYLI
jgi:c-di-GMP-binding flagellar brake protein YcgR